MRTTKAECERLRQNIDAQLVRSRERIQALERSYESTATMLQAKESKLRMVLAGLEGEVAEKLTHSSINLALGVLGESEANEHFYRRTLQEYRTKTRLELANALRGGVEYRYYGFKDYGVIVTPDYAVKLLARTPLGSTLAEVEYRCGAVARQEFCKSLLEGVGVLPQYLSQMDELMSVLLNYLASRISVTRNLDGSDDDFASNMRAIAESLTKTPSDLLLERPNKILIENNYRESFELSFYTKCPPWAIGTYSNTDKLINVDSRYYAVEIGLVYLGIARSRLFSIDSINWLDT